MALTNVTLSRLKTQHEVVEIIIAGLSEEQLRFRPNPDKWSAFENIAHLACYQPRVIARTEKIVVEDNPSFDSYIPKTDSNFPQFVSMSVEKLLAHLKSNRIELIKLVSSLNDEQLKRTGTHSKFGRMNIPEWTEFFLLHEAHHIYTIFKLIRSIKKS